MSNQEIYIPEKYFKVTKEHMQPTTYIYEKGTNKMQGRLEKPKKSKFKSKKRYNKSLKEHKNQIESIKKNPRLAIGKKYGRTRNVRMIKNYSGYKKGEVVARTKKDYPYQKNSTIVRKKSKRGLGKIKGVKIVRRKPGPKKGS